MEARPVSRMPSRSAAISTAFFDEPHGASTLGQPPRAGPCASSLPAARSGASSDRCRTTRKRTAGKAMAMRFTTSVMALASAPGAPHEVCSRAGVAKNRSRTSTSVPALAPRGAAGTPSPPSTEISAPLSASGRPGADRQPRHGPDRRQRFAAKVQRRIRIDPTIELRRCSGVRWPAAVRRSACRPPSSVTRISVSPPPAVGDSRRAGHRHRSAFSDQVP